MENIEAATRINILAKELLKHGIATSAQDAYKQAEARVKNTAYEAKPQTAGADPELAKDVRQMRFALIEASQSIKKLSEQMGALTTDLSSLKTELGLMHGEVQLLKAKAREPRPAPLPEAPQAPQNAQEQAASHMDRIIKPREPEKKPIELDKVFYFGKK